MTHSVATTRNARGSITAPIAAIISVLALLTSLVFAANTTARAEAEIQRVVSPGGIVAWLVEERGLPIIGLDVSWKGGSAHDPVGKEGLAYLLSATMDEGAGDLDSAAFRKALTAKAITISFDSSRDNFNGELKTLSQNRDAAFALLQSALTEPRFDDEPVGRMKRDIASEINRDAQNPNSIANITWFKAALGSGPYARPREGTAETAASLTPADLAAFHKRLIARENMTVSVVGDIDAATLGPLLDKTFGGLPEKSGIEPLEMQEPVDQATFQSVEVNTPQTVIRFGFKGLLRHDPDFVPAFVLNHILGGGTFSSRLYNEVREKRGLAYGVSTSLRPYDAVALWIGGTATRSDRAAQTLKVIRDELGRMAKDGPTETELANAKTYLTGAYPLRFDTNSKIAGQLAGIQREDLGIDYIEKRNGLVEAVTLDDLKRVATRLIKTDQLVVVAVGRAESLESLKPES